MPDKQVRMKHLVSWKKFLEAIDAINKNIFIV